MILSFKTKINGEPTFFVEKILNCISLKSLSEENLSQYFLHTGLGAHRSAPKLHTIRTDEKNRWKKGVLIDFFINARQKNMFRFAPKIPVVSDQSIGIYHLEKSIEVCVDGVYLFPVQIEELAINDGFESVEDFFAYFNKTYHGKIIHWTDLRY